MRRRLTVTTARVPRGRPLVRRLPRPAASLAPAPCRPSARLTALTLVVLVTAIDAVRVLSAVARACALFGRARLQLVRLPRPAATTAAPLAPAPCRPSARLTALTLVILVVVMPVVDAVRALSAVGRAGVRLRRVRAQLAGRRAAPGTGEGAVEVPSARVAEVHDAGRLSSVRVTFLGAAVKVLWETERTVEWLVEIVTCSPH
ncbi:hypothetical protein CTZ28_35650 [Streptomyces shenzhenensis]|uniref:Uncharacterized protein n=1 Tax=Streptomyces shenzhenensis TaxID=943815 RepID=A0A3M0I3J3_9ACTN|nr:hypothetical protein CTZ28_35650 [Streptomyces shenzhenensis]